VKKRAKVIPIIPHSIIMNTNMVSLKNIYFKTIIQSALTISPVAGILNYASNNLDSCITPHIAILPMVAPYKHNTQCVNMKDKKYL